MNNRNLKEVLKVTLPVLAGFLFLGFAFGLLTVTNGFPIYYPILMSVIIYAGSLQFAAIPLLSLPFDPFGSFFLAVMVNARHLFYGLSMLNRYKDAGNIKPFLIFGLTDETFSILSTVRVPEEMKEVDFYKKVTLFNYIYWISGTVLGAVFGRFVSFNLEGLDFALTALFIVLFIEQLKNREGRISGISGLLLTLVTLLIFGKNNMVVIAMVLTVAVLLALRKVIEHE